MKNNFKNIFLSLSFVLIIVGFMLINILTPDTEVSRTERRKLTSYPELNMGTVMGGKYFSRLEDYHADQFIFRDAFRSLKAYTRLYIFGQKENNDMYYAEGHLSKVVYPLDEKSVIRAANKFNKLKEEFFQDNKAYLSIIPDKNYFLASRNNYLSMDYEKLTETILENIYDISYIDIFSELELDDYYFTDIHWRQERIIKVADKLLNKMGSRKQTLSVSYEEEILQPFYGSYYGHAALKIKPDSLIYLNSDLTKKAKVYDNQSGKYSSVYMPELFNGMDPYDVYLSGAKALLTIENPKSISNKELVIFRDSFGSSIAPLLLPEYAKVILIDLRYISSKLLDRYVEFNDKQDVLFLYNTQILNNSGMLK